jgi:hypothetical protein
VTSVTAVARRTCTRVAGRGALEASQDLVKPKPEIADERGVEPSQNLTRKFYQILDVYNFNPRLVIRIWLN